MHDNFYIYILASKKNGVLYIGMTSNLVRRIYEHREGLIPGFTKKYNVKMLVYFEVVTAPADAILREKRLKKWNREWKTKLIESKNPFWKDLYEELA